MTEGGEHAAYWRADAVEVLRASPDRVPPPCPWARPGACGGCDWQHATLPAQRGLKADVVAEQLHRLAELDLDVVVEPVPGDRDGLGWRTRVTYAVDGSGRAGLHPHRSHEVVPIDRCRIAHEDVTAIGVEGRAWPGVETVEAVASSTGEQAVVVRPRRAADRLRLPRLDAAVSVLLAPKRDGVDRVRGRSHLREEAADRSWRVTGGGFWQVHPGAADALTAAVLEALEPQPGERALDLYSGVGLFAGVLASRVGPDGGVVAVESDRRAVADARRNLHEHPGVRLVADRVDRALAALPPEEGADLVVLDPPRTGAGAEVVGRIAALAPRAVAYVACDPAALARDVATFAGLGYRLERMRAFDIFPMTHHVECVALLVRGS